MDTIEAIRDSHERECAVCHFTVERCSIAALLDQNERLHEQLRDRSAYLDWLVNEVCPYHNLECIEVGCPATPPGWQPSL